MNRVEIVDVSPRDGLQNAERCFDPQMRAELCTRLQAAGVSRFEGVSFVNPKRVPQMAEPEAVVALLSEQVREGCIGLVLNDAGLDRLLRAGLRKLRFAFGVSDAFNKSNSGATAEEGMMTMMRVIARAREHGLWVGVSLATSFGCPFAGEVPLARPLEAAQRAVEAGAHEIGFADTIGVSGPSHVRDLVRQAVKLGPPVAIHLHNTRNTGYVNAMAAIEAGATVLDASLGGLGGCPFAPGAAGNIATEDLIYLLDREHLCHDGHLESVVDAAQWLARTTGFALPGQLSRVPPFPPATTLTAVAADS
jgi:isopropylmalate/homocitrate/citramalate synthase